MPQGAGTRLFTSSMRTADDVEARARPTRVTARRVSLMGASLRKRPAAEEEVDEIEDVGDIHLAVAVDVSGDLEAEERRPVALFREPEGALTRGDEARMAARRRNRVLVDHGAADAADLVARVLDEPEVRVGTQRDARRGGVGRRDRDLADDLRAELVEDVEQGDLVHAGLRDRELVVVRGDPARMRAGARERELVDLPGGRDPSDLVAEVLGEPDVPVSGRRDRVGD